ncbi:DEAD/DEAH box helicase [Candidatus Venteria ishoeyi]|uniref:RNA polymerase-associated protein RapA n=1 Tax=Candidatus Venteria ishoeyi TaxID=1899563 RepID=A0A1H6FEW7_9GAMM|nr:DEAD/DEAH box helicase [Candidatus Venteria ishoeyi]SEH07961.1 RNA polymerase-associated protein RapA [Candidatus Venteria ishoeyi]
MTLPINQIVQHPRFGSGSVILDQGKTIVIRFEHGIEECERQILTIKQTLEEKIVQGQWDEPRQTVARILAAAIISINDNWGLFSLSRIQLLPHQLWVCHRVMRIWPANYLIADDVGLGKTIEAGLILWPLISKGLVKRVLILCPASLAEQWQYRLKEMFDLRFTRYVAEADTPRADYWNTHSQVIASLPTLRLDKRGRHQRMFEAEPWDLLIVDEAHHLNAEQNTGATLGYRFIHELIEKGQFKSRVFFSGTPHRGKNYSFIALLGLLRPEKFNPQRPLIEQLPHLRDVLIRNNKQTVTDMHGNLLFKPVKVYPETYAYSSAEASFYSQLTQFILSGKAYAGSLDSAQKRQNVVLVLIAMQKLASSSVAAIRRALQRRLRKLQKIVADKAAEETEESLFTELDAAETDSDALLQDILQRLEENIAESTLVVVKNEIPHLQELVQFAEAVKEETKIQKILELIEEQFPNRQVLFFTEYKATQALLMSALLKKYGDDCVTFINGDERLEDIYTANNDKTTLTIKRTHAADIFNEGKVRFLISTEAGGEGIDLQKNCYSLIHIDLPWNPMRLHQRVGRLNRYGQQHPVEVITLRNPETIESQIWDKLNSKLNNIMFTLREVMDEPEDLLQLILGMTSNSFFTELFSGSQELKKDSVSDWFNEKTKTFGGEEAVSAVKTLVGHSSRFNLSDLSQIPKKDLPDLKPFFQTMLQLNKRRVSESDESIAFVTPEPWLTDPGVRRRYENLKFDRTQAEHQTSNIIGVGHRAFNQALKQAVDYDASIARANLDEPIFIFRVYDKVTEAVGNIRQVIIGVKLSKQTKEVSQVLLDWELLDIFNEILSNLTQEKSSRYKLDSELFSCLQSNALLFVRNYIEKINLPFKVADVSLMSIVWCRHEIEV